MKETSNYYKVVCMCGHVGRNNYIPIPFAIIAIDGKEAASIARALPRVKHHNKHAVLSCERITEEQYEELKRINDENPYLSCKNIQEQRKHKEIEEQALPMPKERTPLKKKEQYSAKYLKWKRYGKYNTIDIEEEYCLYYENRDELILSEAI